MGQNAMARNDDRDLIGATPLPDRLRGDAEIFGDLAISAGPAEGNVDHRLPHGLREIAGGAFEGQIEHLQPPVEIGVDLACHFGGECVVRRGLGRFTPFKARHRLALERDDDPPCRGIEAEAADFSRHL